MRTHVSKNQAGADGFDESFANAGFKRRELEWLVCSSTNSDILSFGGRPASTSNRGFECDSDAGGKAYIKLSVMTTAAAGIASKLADMR